MKKVFDEQEIEELLKPYPQPKQLGNGFAGQEVNSELEHAETWPNWRIDGSWQPVLDQLKPGSELVLLI